MLLRRNELAQSSWAHDNVALDVNFLFQGSCALLCLAFVWEELLRLDAVFVVMNGFVAATLRHDGRGEVERCVTSSSYGIIILLILVTCHCIVGQ